MTRRLPVSSDPKEQQLREAWYAARGEWEAMGKPDSGPAAQGFQHVDRMLAAYLWARTQADIEADRKQHPKAKRNLPVGAEAKGGGGRVLP